MIRNILILTFLIMSTQACVHRSYETALIGAAIGQIGKPTGDRKYFQRDTLRQMSGLELSAHQSVVNISSYSDRKSFICRGVLIDPTTVITILSCLKGGPAETLVVDNFSDFTEFSVQTEITEKNLVVLTLKKELAQATPASRSKVQPINGAPGFMGGYTRNFRKTKKLKARPIYFRPAEEEDNERIELENFKDGFVPPGVPVFDVDGELVGLVEGDQKTTYDNPVAVSLIDVDLTK